MQMCLNLLLENYDCMRKNSELAFESNKEVDVIFTQVEGHNLNSEDRGGHSRNKDTVGFIFFMI